MNCYEAIDLMADALDDRLPDVARPGFAEHLDECPPCRNYLDQLRLTLSALEHLPRSSASSNRRSELIAQFRKSLRPDA